jgi:hypothetical protein
MRTSEPLIWTTTGLGFAPRPNVMYPVSPVSAPIPVTLEVTGRGVVISVAVMAESEKMAYSIAGYAKHAESWLWNAMARGEWGNGASFTPFVKKI